MEGTLTRPQKQFPAAVAIIVVLIALAALWEAVKLFFAISDGTLPHLWQILAAFINPARRSGPPLWTILLSAALFTAGNALAGFAIGALLGFSLGTLFAHAPLLERSLVPYIVASQTIDRKSVV